MPNRRSRRVTVLFGKGWPVEWTSDVVDATPRYCMRCETKVTAIRIVPLPLSDAYLIRCGHCNFALVRLSAEQFNGGKEDHERNPAPPPLDQTDTAWPSDP